MFVANLTERPSPQRLNCWVDSQIAQQQQHDNIIKTRSSPSGTATEPIELDDTNSIESPSQQRPHVFPRLARALSISSLGSHDNDPAGNGSQQHDQNAFATDSSPRRSSLRRTAQQACAVLDLTDNSFERGINRITTAFELPQTNMNVEQRRIEQDYEAEDPDVGDCWSNMLRALSNSVYRLLKSRNCLILPPAIQSTRTSSQSLHVTRCQNTLNRPSWELPMPSAGPAKSRIMGGNLG